MKNLFKNLMLVAVVAMGFTACNNENFEEAVRTNEPAEVVMTITAEDATRTFIDEANSKVQWSETDALKVIENSANYRTTTKTTITDGKAQFTVSFAEDTTSESFTYNAVYPASAVVEEDNAGNVNNERVKVILKDTQVPTAISFDPTADILVSKQIVTDAQPKELNMQFARLVALAKMTLTNLPGDAEITKVSFTAPTGKKLAGRNYVDTTTGLVSEYGYYGATNTITLNYNEAISTRDIFFTCNPFEMAAEEVFTVKVTCKDYIYTREVAIPADRSLAFTEGDLTTFKVNMKDATTEENTVFPDGVYAVLAHNNGKYYALSSSNSNSSSRLNSVDDVVYSGEGAFATNDETLKWTINYTEDEGYTFKSTEGKYIAWYNNGNYAKTQDDAYYLDIAKDGETGRYIVTSKITPSRKLQRNKDVENTKYFAFYTSEQYGSLCIVPVVADTNPRFTVTPNTAQTITSEGGNIQFTVTAYNGAVVTATENVDWLTIDGNFNATVEENEGEERTATITFSAEGCNDVEVTITQSEYVEPSQPGEDETVTHDFTAITGFSSWGNSYSKHTVEYDEATVEFTTASKQTQTITDMPVSKVGPIILKAKEDRTIKSFTLTCKQWGSKAKTLSLQYSTDGGTSFTNATATWSNLVLTASSLPDDTNAVKVVFGGSASNQIGIQKAEVTYAN